jgi:hypothetical protein
MLQAQLDFAARYEQKHNWLRDRYIVVPNDKEGVLIVQADYDAASKEYPIFFKHLNQDLEKVWEDTARVSQRFFIKGYAYSEQKNFVLLQNDFKHSIKILKVDAGAGVIKDFESKEIADLEITHFEVVRNTGIIGGYFEDRPVVFAYDLANNKVRTLPNVFQNRSDLLDVKINNDSLSFNVLVSIPTEEKTKSVLVSTYDYEGNVLRDYTIRPKPDYELLTSVSSSINDISQVVVGLYGYKSSYAISGFYVNHVDRTGQQTMNYYNLGELPRFLDYSGEKRAARLKKRALDLKKSGKEARYKLKASLRGLNEKDGKLILQAEFFRSYSQNNNFRDISNLRRFDRLGNYNNLYNGSNQLDNSTISLPENSVTHAYTLVMDQKGNVEWDDYMEIDEDFTGDIDRYGSFNLLDDKASYIFYKDEELFMKHLSPDGNSEVLTTELKLLEEEDELTVEKRAGLGTVRWYDNNFLVYGVHHIRPKDRSKPTRKVFFINKVAVTGEPIPAPEK